jgi:integrase
METKAKCEWITPHTCRRSFSTNEFLDGTPVDLIMAISGHRTEKTFRKYIKADNLQKAHMIRKLWEQDLFVNDNVKHLSLLFSLQKV